MALGKKFCLRHQSADDLHRFDVNITLTLVPAEVHFALDTQRRSLIEAFLRQVVFIYFDHDGAGGIGELVTLAGYLTGDFAFQQHRCATAALLAAATVVTTAGLLWTTPEARGPMN